MPAPAPTTPTTLVPAVLPPTDFKLDLRFCPKVGDQAAASDSDGQDDSYPESPRLSARGVFPLVPEGDEHEEEEGWMSMGATVAAMTVAAT